MPRARPLALTTLLALAALCGCADQPVGVPPASTSTPAPRPRATPHELADTVHAAVVDERSARVWGELSDDAGPARVDGSLRFTAQGTDVDVTVERTARQEETDPATRRTRVVTVGSTTYLRPPPGVAPQDRPWVRVDPGSSDPFQRYATLFSTTVRSMVDPDRLLTVAVAGGRITRADVESLDGTDAVHYGLQVELPGGTPHPGQSPEFRALADAGVRSMSYELWVDGRDLPVRARGAQRVPSLGDVTSDVRFHDWGQSVRIEAPPRNEVSNPA
ncbi:hypothetical protein LX15_002396 [Streptoalloteichus tenebrarius]|uniref:Lipoprotein n=1 Tax=Streptoalloteichus tenebrarius (strain ATCC 17920 / DSM 40477 / JCM 4838 / CBS 697.72 / NBRC 16177 / NCIMB 11028 / NRRL B-12390 / A12253. 1 / ISP 5477) TaxID=1933 RepID=A0ABT1HT90_STRSD|nr:hypothetical protein [Streptoalloteichus tenebrarius]MCP2258698.1 hypothetical protein [Streptoalloteichus tenebrarius]BFF02844.1 hypothetical protein GCM10020241_45190 [Streptoalloteichus tenebrarius]